MKQLLNHRITARRMLGLAFVFSLALPLPALAASVALATAPLANATTTTVLPNLMFVMDASGSMDSNYLPDWANDSVCKNTDGSYSLSCVNQPLFQSPDFNGVYYNPAIYYRPAVNADGSSKASQLSPWTSVKNDAYNIQDTGSTNLVTGYTDREWCTSTSYTDCLRNDNYILPGVVNSKTYATAHTVTSTGSGSVATGSPAAPTTAARTWGPHYYTITPGEYCDSAQLTNCQTTQAGSFTFPAKLRWCNSAANASATVPAAGSCKGLRTVTGGFTNPRFPTRFYTAASAAVVGVAAVPASATFSLATSGCTSTKLAGIQSITVNGSNILPSATANESSATTLAGDVRSKTAAGGYSFSGSGNTFTVIAPIAAGNVTYAVTLARTASSNSACTFSPMSATLGGYTPAVVAQPAVAAAYYGSFVRTDIIPSITSYPFPGSATKASGRSDCAGTTCTYAEEMTNFANWWTYYQTRMQTMKSAVSLAFKPIDNRYRVGFIDLWGTNYLPIAKFDAGTGSVKANWYAKLFSMNPMNNTPLRSALSRVGRIFAGKKPVGSSDPMQFSCQQNFTLMTTDGYWNNDTNADVLNITGGQIGDMDSVVTTRPMYEGPTATSATLADAAKYYFDTDLRTAALGNCTGGPDDLGVTHDVCENNVFVSSSDSNVQQHMTTFTLGLGVDGTLNYTSDYKTAASGDFYSITNGLGKNWPVPVADTETAVDDLWHAAVNGQGTYFSAKDPNQLTSGLNGALASIGSKLGAGAAAATSTLNPVAGDNFAYVASYTTVKWQGNLEARSINLRSGVISEAATWCVEDVVAGTCSAPGSVVADTTGGSTVYNCVTPGATASTCGGILTGSTCYVELPKACSGTLSSQVAATSDTRTIKFKGASGALTDFTYANLPSAQQAYFTGSSLSQYTVLDAAQQTAVAGNNLVNYLRGQKGFEDDATVAANRLYRRREAVMGDALESQPTFVGQPYFRYNDPGYSGFVAAQAGRPKTVYMGANDGMLHAFDAVTGVERWAYVPSMVIPNMWKLADKNYATMHTNYVNGKTTIGDVYVGGAWKTILVGSLNGGGRGYYALDVTDPVAPVLLWEIDSSTDADLGYSFGPAVITKKADGTWVVLLSSGYNNTSPGTSGHGYLYVRNVMTGAAISKIDTGAGDTATPSGFARFAGFADDPIGNNTSIYVYGGDLLGNVWRIDINTGTVLKFAILKDAGGNTQPITAKPEESKINGKRVIFVATGKYLETSDLTTTQTQTVYAMQDDGATATFVNPRATLVQQTLTTSGASRTSSSNPVDFSSVRGWYVDFPDTGERANVDPKLDSGTLFVPTTVPSNTVCSPGGYGWLNYFNYATGGLSTGAEGGLTGQKFNAPIVGINIIYLPPCPDCSPAEKIPPRVVSVVTSDHPTPDKPKFNTGGGSAGGGFLGTKVMWRELIQ